MEKDLRRHLESEFGLEIRDRYFAILEELRSELGYTDYLGALQRFRLDDHCDPRLLSMSSFLVDYHFTDRLYPGALAVLEHVRAWGTTVILFGGDVVFQSRKVQWSGLWDVVEGRVSFTFTKRGRWLILSGTTPRGVTSWWTTSCEFLQP